MTISTCTPWPRDDVDHLALRERIMDDPWLLSPALQRVLLDLKRAANRGEVLTRDDCRTTTLGWLREGKLITIDGPWSADQPVLLTHAGAVAARLLLATKDDPVGSVLRGMSQDARLTPAERDAVGLLIHAADEIASGSRGGAA